MKKNIWAFTLVELMVVVVILSVLSAVWFISYENYLVDTRDSKRLTQLAWIRDSMRLWITKGKLPLPDDYVEIRNNGTAFLYQWYAGERTLESIAYASEVLDPLDDIPYTYLVSRNRKDFQLLGFLEKYNQDVILSFVENGYAYEDYSQRFPNVFGKKLGILLEQNSNTPLQEMPTYTISWYIDLQDSTTNMFDAYVTDTYIISGKEDDLIGIIPYTTCKKILESWGTYGNGIYNINPSWLNPFEVYCDMEIDGWGWTLVWRSIAWTVGGDFWWLVSNGNIRNDESLYSLWASVVDLNFSEILLTDYTNWKNYTRGVKVWVDRNFIKDENNYLSLVDTNYCQEVYPVSTAWRSPCDTNGQDGKSGNRNMLRKWWFFHKKASDGWGPTDNRFHFRNTGNDSHNYGNMWLARDGFQADASGNQSAAGELEGKQWMIFVR